MALPNCLKPGRSLYGSMSPGARPRVTLPLHRVNYSPSRKAGAQNNLVLDLGISIPVLKDRLTGLFLSLRLRSAPSTTPLAGVQCTGGRSSILDGLRCFAFSGGTGAPAMIPRICGLCEQQFQGKPASLYWAWTNADGRRRAWKQKVCPDCLREHYARAILASQEPVLMCPQCGIGTVDDYDAVYLTYCIPGMPKAQAEMPCCPPCAVALRSLALKGASELEDRGVGAGGPQLEPVSADQAWKDLFGSAPS